MTILECPPPPAMPSQTWPALVIFSRWLVDKDKPVLFGYPASRVQCSGTIHNGRTRNTHINSALMQTPWMCTEYTATLRKEFETAKLNRKSGFFCARSRKIALK